MKLSIINITQL